jgi:DNA-binding MarR family transcriptional regulator
LVQEPPSARADSAAAEFLAGFDTFVQAVRRARGARAQGGERALTLSQYALLSGLADRTDARVRELASKAGVTASTATRILDALERRGIISRAPADDDRRAVTVTLTELGRELLNEQDDWLRAHQLDFYERLPPGERELAPHLLVRLAALIDELAAGPAENAGPA